MKISEVIDKLIEFHQPYKNEKTRDTVKAGNPDQECTGIVVTVCATAEVIEKAAAINANLIITHESIFFGDEYAIDEFGENVVLKKKQELLEKTGIVVWRDHDHMHGAGKPFHPVRYNPDYIYYGIMKELGWEDYVMGDKLKPLWYKIPETTVDALARFLMEKLNLSGVRIVGSTTAPVSTVFVSEHVSGRGDLEKIKQAEKADVMIPLEINDWTLSAYVRDADYFGIPKSILEFGHFNFEELGMKYMAEWLPDVVQADVPVTFVQSGDSFHYMLREA